MTVDLIDQIDLNRIDKLKINNADKSFLSVLAQYARDIPGTELRKVVHETKLSGDARAVAEEIIRLSEGGAGQAPKSSRSTSAKSRSGVGDFARVLVEWAAAQGN